MKSGIITPLLGALSFLLISVSLYLVFAYVPNERLMGPIQRVFYFHVGSAIACYLAYGILFITSLLYLGTRENRYDIVTHAAGEVGFVFCTVVLVSGMIWGHTAWNTWFRWEPRLVTFLLLWLVFLSFFLLRHFGDPTRIASHASVMGILGAITVPAVIYSVKLLPAAAQLHPQVIENRGLKDPSFELALLVTTCALIVFLLFLVFFRVQIETLKRCEEARNAYKLH